MIHLKRDIADIKRLKEILGIVFDEGFPFILENANLKRFLPLKHKLKRKKEHKESNEVRLRKTLERLGPTFIKFGQVLSIRPDFVPKSYIRELEKLLDDVPAFSFNEVKKEIEDSTGRRLDEIFRKFEKEPVAAASIAQVHKAILKNGEKVAVKVKRPNIDYTIESDIEIMLFIARLLDKHIKGLRKYRPVKIIEEFAEWTKKELNFNIETENIRRIYENFKGSKTTKIPIVYPEYCNERLIVMEYIDGVELNKIGKKKTKRDDVKKALKNGFYSILEQVFIHGIFHADPHPSNILILKDNKVALVDFGIVGKFDDNLKDEAVNLLIGITSGDTEKVIDVLFELGEVNGDKDLKKIRGKISDAIYPLSSGVLKEIKISSVLEEVLDIALEFGIKMPREFVLFAKTIVTMEGIALSYYPDFRFGEMIKPFLEEVIIDKYSPKRLIRKNLMNAFRLKKLIEKIPGQTARVLNKLEKGEIKIEMRDTDIERLSVELDKSSNRLTYGMIIAALLISGSVTINLGDKVFYGLSIVSILCFMFAGFLGFALFISIINEKR